MAKISSRQMKTYVLRFMLLFLFLETLSNWLINHEISLLIFGRHTINAQPISSQEYHVVHVFSRVHDDSVSREVWKERFISL
jgi:hypothetical protein